MMNRFAACSIATIIALSLAACGKGDTNGASGSSGSGGDASTGVGGGAANHAFIILMENANWVDLKGSTRAPYINSLLATGAHAEQYYNPPGIHPSEPNYLWLEAGANFGVTTDDPPATNHQSTTEHLVSYLDKAGLSWKSYQEDISGTDCPLTAVNNYAPKHNPMVFFDDVTNNLDAMAVQCIAHVRPYTELATDLANNKVANYNFITPNLCDDMHNTCAPLNDSTLQGDTWLSTEVPKLLASQAYQDGAIIFITWDEGELSDGPIGMIVLSKRAKKGYSNTKMYTHSSTLRSMQILFGVTPFLRDAANASDLSDLFTSFP